MSDEGYDPAGRLHEFNVVAYSLFMAVVVIAITVCCVFCREERDGTVRKNQYLLYCCIAYIIF